MLTTYIFINELHYLKLFHFLYRYLSTYFYFHGIVLVYPKQGSKSPITYGHIISYHNHTIKMIYYGESLVSFMVSKIPVRIFIKDYIILLMNQ